MISDIRIFYYLCGFKNRNQHLMKKIILSLLTVAALVAGCAKHAPSGANDANKRYFDAWMEVNHPGVKPTGLGIYIIEDTPGTGIEVKEEGYAQIEYVITDLLGNISSYTYKVTAEQLGEYTVGNYYGPKFQSTIEGTILAGLNEVLVGMKVGGYRKAVVPSWLMSYSDYDSEEDYLEVATDKSSTIYDITVTGFTEDITEWQIDEIGGYFKKNTDVFGTMTIADSIPDYKGFYYKQLAEPVDTTSFPKDTTVYINYTGRLLDGTVFDTTDERLAKDCGIWSSSRTYEPMQVNWGEEFTDITMGDSGSSVITGFALTLWQMRENEKGIGVFISDYGYGYTGSGQSIPGFAPLVFEIELVAKPED